MYMAISPGGGIGDTVIVSGGSGINYNALNNATSDLDLKFDQDGNEYVSKNGAAYVQRNAANCWLRPTVSAPGLYEIRYTSASGSGNLSGPVAENAWRAFSTGDFIMNIFDTVDSVPNENATFTIEVRLDGGPVLNSGVYTIQANFLS